MGKLVRGLTGAIGLATEAYARRSRSPSASAQHVGGPSPPGETSQRAVQPPTYSVATGGGLITSGSLSDSKRKEEEDEEPEFSDDDEASDDDMSAWALDDAQSSLADLEPENVTTPPAYSDVDTIIQSFAAVHLSAEIQGTSHIGRLIYPVILPQKRPGSKERGFVRAYAPVLADCGIDQPTFLDFLDSFSAATKVRTIAGDRSALSATDARSD